MGATESKEILWNHVKEVKGQLETLPVTSWICDNPWKSLGIFITSKIFIWDWLLFRVRNRSLPPGPMGLPFLGSFFLMGNDVPQELGKLGDKYGDVFYLRMPKKDMVVLNSMRAIKEAYLRRGTEFAGRPNDELGDILNFHDEIFMASYDEDFKNRKKFAVNALRNLGFGARSMESKIQTEVDRVCDYIRSQSGKPIDLEKPLQKGMANIICSILFNKQFAFDDPEIEEVITMASDFFSVFSDIYLIVMLPKYIAYPLNMSTYKMAREKAGKSRRYVAKMIEEHKATFDPDNPRDFIDAYLRGRQDISAQALTDTVTTFFPDAIHSTGMLLRWIILYAVRNPEVQTRMQKDIDEVIGQSRNPSQDDMGKLTYIEAVIKETMRICDFMPMLPSHSPAKDCNLFGYRIPGNVELMANVHNVHFDKEIYPEPEVFKPERFLEKNGELAKTDAFLAFGIGPRTCMGKALARQEMFITITNLFQKFHFKFPDDKAPTTDTIGDLSPLNFSAPQNYEIIAVPR